MNDTKQECMDVCPNYAACAVLTAMSVEEQQKSLDTVGEARNLHREAASALGESGRELAELLLSGCAEGPIALRSINGAICRSEYSSALSDVRAMIAEVASEEPDSENDAPAGWVTITRIDGVTETFENKGRGYYYDDLGMHWVIPDEGGAYLA